LANRDPACLSIPGDPVRRGVVPAVWNWSDGLTIRETSVMRYLLPMDTESPDVPELPAEALVARDVWVEKMERRGVRWDRTCVAPS
jgi:hypothetical protein